MNSTTNTLIPTMPVSLSELASEIAARLRQGEGLSHDVIVLQQSIQDLVESRVQIIADECAKHQLLEGDSDYGSFMSWSYDGDTVRIDGETSGCGRGCCGPERRAANFPAAILFLSDADRQAFYIERALVKKEEARKSREEKALQQAEAARVQAEEDDRKRRETYEKLKQEFEGVSA